MAEKKRVREKGKLRLSHYFATIRNGERVAVVPELKITHSFPARLHGRSGVVAGSRGRAKIVEMNEGSKRKTFLIHPVHLRRLNYGN